MKRLSLVLLVVGTLASTRAANAEVVDSSATGFTVKVVTEVAASPDKVYDALIHIGSWWHSAHTYSGNAANLSLDPKAGGCFCESLPSGGSVQHMTVVFVMPGKMLRLTGGLGPLQTMAVASAMEWKLTPSAGKTRLEMTYQVGGYAPGGVGSVAAPVDMVTSMQVSRLKRLAETGNADEPKLAKP